MAAGRVLPRLLHAPVTAAAAFLAAIFRGGRQRQAGAAVLKRTNVSLMKNEPLFKFVAAAIFAAVCTAFYSATHFQTQELYRDAVVPTTAATPSP
jgi:hypothetical protein